MSHKTKLKLTLFWTDYGDDNASKQHVHETYLRRMRELLDKYGLGLTTLPVQRSEAFTLPFKDVFKEYPEYETPAQAGKLRNLANQKYPGKNNDRPGSVIIFVPFARVQTQYGKEPSRAGGMTFGYNKAYTKRIPVDGINWPPFALINSRHESPDHGTLLHEVGHTAGLDHLDDSKNIMSYGKSRSELYDNQVATLKKAYFAGS